MTAKTLHIVLLVFLMGLFSEVKGQANTIAGTVRDSSGDPLAGAEVSIGSLNRSTTTDSLGQFRFREVPKGSYKLQVFALSYGVQTERIAIEETRIHIDIALDPLGSDLPTVTVDGAEVRATTMKRLAPVEGTSIYAGKKNEVVTMDRVNGNKAAGKSREIYAKVAGLNIWESDAGGLQVDLGGRGLDPSRTANFNTRQNGYDMSADALGYPETYYKPPAEAVERIKVIRGAASLQYGPQFGGMIDYELKKPPDQEKFRVRSRQTTGSYGLFNTFNSIGGKEGKVGFYSYFNDRSGKGWRDNSDFQQTHWYGRITMELTEHSSLSAEYTHMNYLAQQPGGLTDRTFEEDPSRSIRERNWFRVHWNLGALRFKHRFNSRTRLESRFFGLRGSREALGFLGPINREDHGEERTLLKDDYRNFGNETRFIHSYELGESMSTIMVGARFYKGRTDRRNGFGNDGKGPSFSFIHDEPREESDFEFPSNNKALFAEHLFYLTPKLSFTPGIRYERISTGSKGWFSTVNEDLAGNVIFTDTLHKSRKRERSIFLYGAGLSYQPHNGIEIYANYSRNYRGIGFNDLRVKNPNFRVDPEIRDERGYTADFGVRGRIPGTLNYDVNAFLLHYNERIGAVLRTDTTNYQTFRYRTNIADSRHFGIEALIESELLQLTGIEASSTKLLAFVNFSWLDARYINSKESAFEGNQVEMAPPLTFKGGFTFQYKSFEASLQHSYTAKHYTDATNAKRTPNAVNGIIPAYDVTDLSLGYEKGRFTLEGGINNLLDRHYFTRRATGYPGPGIIPAQDRTYYVTVGVELSTEY